MLLKTVRVRLASSHHDRSRQYSSRSQSRRDFGRQVGVLKSQLGFDHPSPQVFKNFSSRSAERKTLLCAKSVASRRTVGNLFSYGRVLSLNRSWQKAGHSVGCRQIPAWL